MERLVLLPHVCTVRIVTLASRLDSAIYSANFPPSGVPSSMAHSGPPLTRFSCTIQFFLCSSLANAQLGFMHNPPLHIST